MALPFNSLAHMFDSVEKTDDPCVVCDDGSNLTSKDFDHITAVLASDLMEKYGVVKGDTCGIYMEKSLEYVIAYTATLRAGAGYMPIDVSYPQPLLSSIIEESEPKVVFTKSYLVDKLHSANKSSKSLILERSMLENLRSAAYPTLKSDVTSQDLAYIVYSSGTTGKPKGVCCPHQGAVFSYTSRMQEYPYTANEREACNVFFVWELFRPIISGIPLYIIPDDVIYDPGQLCDFIERHQITRILFTPSLLLAVWDTVDSTVLKSKLDSLKFVLRFWCDLHRVVYAPLEGHEVRLSAAAGSLLYGRLDCPKV